MQKYEREVRGKELICRMLDMMDTIHVGIFDETYPYVVPLNFGYSFEDTLTFYIHCALKGKKLELLAKNPNVCVTASKFFNFPDRPYKQMLHDYRSVMAFGTFSLIENTGEYGKAFQALLRQYGRKPKQFDPKRVNKMYLGKIECSPDNVTAKAEFPIHSANDVPFVDVYHELEDTEPFVPEDWPCRRL